MGPTSGPHGQYIDVFHREIVSKLRNSPVLTWLETKDKNQCVFLISELVRNYEKDNWEHMGPKWGRRCHCYHTKLLFVMKASSKSIQNKITSVIEIKRC